MKLTTRKVNAELRKAGYKLALCQGRGYLYFYVPEDHGALWLACEARGEPTHSVYVNTLNQLSLEQWIDHAKDANEAIWPST